ncbi:hypothetical protein RFI_26363, partial [Reticulomyxa filosa]
MYFSNTKDTGLSLSTKLVVTKQKKIIKIHRIKDRCLPFLTCNGKRTSTTLHQFKKQIKKSNNKTSSMIGRYIILFLDNLLLFFIISFHKKKKRKIEKMLMV